MQANQLRAAWNGFWSDRGHVLVPSAGLIPHHRTAPMFTNAGMNQFVPIFLGEEPAPYRRAASVQKCVRLSGKHNDIDELGKTRRHLTFFEMLGNFSFGDYFKEDAIAFAWDLVTGVGFDGERIWITVHESDDDAEAIWHERVGLPLGRIQRLGKENFWEMGATGPCGPSSEVHYDCGPEWGEGGGPARGSDDRYVEFWNLVFMESFRHDDGHLSALPARNVDTGGGLERWLMLLDNVPTVFDTDALRPILAMAESMSGATYGHDARTDVALRVVADHARTMTMLVNDGVTPSNEDRGYVLRSVIRRAVRHLYQLGVDRPVLADLVPTVVEGLADAYPDLARNRDAVAIVVGQEEERFRHTLRSGSALLDEALASGHIDGGVAFKLHDTFGFPIEITEEVAMERGVDVDRAGFDRAMDEQRRRAKAARRAGAPVVAVGDQGYRQLLDEYGPTEFTGYGEASSKATVLAVLGAGDTSVEIFLDKTPFYAEGGGQVGDTGIIETETGQARVVDTTQALPRLHRHTAEILRGTITPGQEATATIDGERRQAIRRNHTATHLLHWALREMFGSQLQQKGSYVGPDYLRFDFSHSAPVSAQQLRELEDLVNGRILENEPVRAYETTKAEAEGIGAIAFFGDKYGEIVRVIEAGSRSIELCGGTHVPALGTIGPFKVVSEGSIGSNQRRIEATTGVATLERVRHEEDVLGQAAELLRATPDDLVEALEKLLGRSRAAEDEVRALRAASARDRAADLALSAVDGLVIARVDGVDANALKDLAIAVRDRPGIGGVVLIGTPDTTRVALVAAVRADSALVAHELIGDAARIVGGGGGKQADIATAGGNSADKIDEALVSVRSAAGLSSPP